ncbi:hypothetical protein BH23ACT4_BH23ACT4_03690 [soil metagenome]
MDNQLGWTLHSEWLSTLRWMYESGKLKAAKGVAHRGHVYPAEFDVTWKRDDGLEVEISIRVDREEGPTAMSATIRGPAGIHADYRQPIPSMTRQAAAQIAFVRSGPGAIQPASDGPIPMGTRATKRTDRSRLENVANLYRQAIDEGLGVTELIEVDEFVSRDTAYGLIKQARKAGLLPPSKPGRKAQQ